MLLAKTVIGLPENGSIRMIVPGETFTTDESIKNHLLEVGAAEEIKNKALATRSEGPVGDLPNGNLPEGQNAPEGKLGAIPEVERETEFVEEELEGVDLESMKFDELKAYAKELGIETGKIKSKAGMIEAIKAYAETGIPADDMPELVAQDVVDE